MAKNFRADQIEVKQIILSGGISTPGTRAANLGALIYSGSNPPTSNRSGGRVGPNLVNVGDDVMLFVSGNIGGIQKNLGSVTLFGGDLAVSGTIFAAGEAGGLISGSITKTNEGRSYLRGAGGTTVTSASNGQIVISSPVGGGSTQNLFETIAVAGQSDVVADDPADTLTLVGGSNVTITTNAGSDQITFAATDTNTMGAGFVMEDDSGDEVTITENKEVKIIGAGGITTNWTDVSAGSDSDPYDLTITAADLSFAGDGGAPQSLTLGDTFTIEGGTNVTTSMTSDKVTINATDTNETYDLNAVQDGDNVDLHLVSTSGGDDSVVQLTAGANITLTRNSSAEVTIAAAADSDTTYTLSAAEDGDNVDITLDASGGGTDSTLQLTAGSNVTLTRNSAAEVTIAATDTNTQLTTEQVQDIVGDMVSGNTETNITVTYVDEDGTLDFVVTDTDTTYTAGDGIDLSGTEFSADLLTNGGLTIESQKIAINTVGENNAIMGRSTGTPIAADLIWFSDNTDDTIKNTTISTLLGLGSEEWTDEGSILRPSDASGVQHVGIGSTGTVTTAYNIFLSSSGGAVFNNAQSSNVNANFRVATSGRKYGIHADAVKNQVVILSDTAQLKNDVAFFVSGAIGDKGNPSASKRGTAVFGGDTVISGALHILGPPSSGYDYEGAFVPAIVLDSNSASRIVWDPTLDRASDAPDAQIYEANQRLVLSGSGQLRLLVGGEKIGGDGNRYGDLRIDVDGVNHLMMSSSQIDGSNQKRTTFNAGGANLDFVVESVNEDEAILLDASADTLYINKGGSAFTTIMANEDDEVFRISSAGAIFNDDKHTDVDFRVASLNQAHMLFVDSSKNGVGIGTNAVQANVALHVTDPTNSGRAIFLIENESATSYDAQLSFAKAGSFKHTIGMDDSDSDKLKIALGDTLGSSNQALMDFPSATGGAIVVNEDAQNHDFRVEGGASLQGAMLVDAGTNQVLLGTNSTTAAGENLGTDVNIFFDGTQDSKDTNVKGTAVFNGDLLTSGTLYIEGSRTVGTRYSDAAIILSSIPDTNSRIVWDTFAAAGNAPGLPDAQIYEAGGHLYLSSSEQVIIAGGTERVTIDSNGMEYFKADGESAQREIVFNEDSNDIDFRVESDSKTHMLFVEASENKIGINTSDPDRMLHVHDGYLRLGEEGTFGSTPGTSTVGYARLEMIANENSSNVQALVQARDETLQALQVGTTTSHDVRLFSNNSTRMIVKSDGKVGIGTTAPANKLQVNHGGSDGNNGIMVVRADSSTVSGNLLGGIGFDSTDGNNPSSITEASAFIAAYASENHGVGDKGGKLVLGTTENDDDDDTTSHERVTIENDGIFKTHAGRRPNMRLLDVGNAANLIFGDDHYVILTGTPNGDSSDDNASYIRLQRASNVGNGRKIIIANKVAEDGAGTLGGIAIVVHGAAKAGGAYTFGDGSDTIYFSGAVGYTGFNGSSWNLGHGGTLILIADADNDRWYTLGDMV